MEAAPLDIDSGADALLQATSLVLSRLLTHDELKVHLATNYAGLRHVSFDATSAVWGYVCIVFGPQNGPCLGYVCICVPSGCAPYYTYPGRSSQK